MSTCYLSPIPLYFLPLNKTSKKIPNLLYIDGMAFEKKDFGGYERLTILIKNINLMANNDKR